MSKTADKKPSQGLTLDEMIGTFLDEGKITKKGMEEAQRELEADPEWQAYVASQPKPAAA